MKLKTFMKPVPELNMIPMIDVIMMLLIFFLVATQMKTQENAAGVQLPTSLEALVNPEKPSPLVINILPRNESDKPYAIAGFKLNNEELLRVLRVQSSVAIHEGGEMAYVRIRADRRSDLAQLQDALRACQVSHIKEVFIAAECPK